MKHLELHIIQSVPVACLNRDDLNSPKTAMFGGVQRARVSSQAWKSPIREEMKAIEVTLFKGNRSRRMVSELSSKLQKKGIERDASVIISEHVADIIETLDSKTDGDGFKKIKTLMFFSEAEYDAIVDAVTDEIRSAAEAIRDLTATAAKVSEVLKGTDEEKKEPAKKELEKLEKEMEKNRKALAKAFNDKKIRDTIKSVQLKDAADIALFGRMVANDHSLTVEAASMFSHALSTHKADSEIDFFTAVDDLQREEESGAAITGTLEFNSATYYRFAALNLDMLADADHLGAMTHEQRQSVVRAFIEATIKAMPVARKYTMNGNTVPVYVLGVVREKGHPIQLVNAFENPVPYSKKGFVIESIKRANAEFSDLKDTWGVDSVFAKAVVKGTLKEEIKESLGSIETCFLDNLIDGMVAHVI
ncbi:MAG: type I-E CRISPR-associated protein Cas7/Cse4/CasC [Syntrophorhabdus aromaticivorans]|uniref:Type I-E CRISPR-associated protein Cas7/Cse4/CasC n=1 Tax=Syntrophorhabdus aromaticivorans TaxID=328301 RepID=A0A971S1C6_9BACT|nr:type I-E CRISPR-associated protein Cas7/Cse4/CasC [Syntrophorhabdus aromaticivorans]